MENKYNFEEAVNAFVVAFDLTGRRVTRDCIERVLWNEKHLNPEDKQDFLVLEEMMIWNTIVEKTIEDAGQGKIDIGVDKDGMPEIMNMEDDEIDRYFDSILYGD
jgi:peptide subunit release factor 1 (eRF1)